MLKLALPFQSDIANVAASTIKYLYKTELSGCPSMSGCPSRRYYFFKKQRGVESFSMRRTAFSSTTSSQPAAGENSGSSVYDFSSTARERTFIEDAAAPAAPAAPPAPPPQASPAGEQLKVKTAPALQIPKRAQGESAQSFMRRMKTWHETKNKQLVRRLTPTNQGRNKSRNASRSQTPKKSKLRQCPRKDQEGKPNPCGNRSGSRASECKGCGAPFIASEKKRSSVNQERYRKKRRVKEAVNIDWASASPQRKLEFLEQKTEKCAICQEPLSTKEIVQVCDCGHKMHKECAIKWAHEAVKKSFPVCEYNPHSILSTSEINRGSQQANWGKFQCPSYCQKWQCFPVFEGDGTTPSRDANILAELETRFEGPPKSLWDLHFARSQILRRDVIEYNRLLVDCVERGLFPDATRRQDIRELAQMHGLGPLEFLRMRLRLADEIEEQRLAHAEALRRQTAKEFVITKEALQEEPSLGLEIDEADGTLIINRVVEVSLAAKVGMVPNTTIQELKMETATNLGRVTHSMSPCTVQEMQSFLKTFKTDPNAVQFIITTHPNQILV